MHHEILPVPGYEGHYSVSNTGDIFSHKRGGSEKLKAHPDRTGYLRLRLCKDGNKKGEQVHRIVAKAFLTPASSTDTTVNHLNGIKTFNHATNLQWTTDAGNMQHAHDMGLINKARGVRHGSAKLDEIKVRQIRSKRTAGASYTSLAAEYGVARPTIIHVCLNRTWTHVENKACNDIYVPTA